MSKNNSRGRRGRFISFEGVDGAGKSTQLDALCATLRQRGIDVLQTREPGGTALGEELRALMLGRTMAPLTETLLMFAARNEHVLTCIAPALSQGRWILCDRFTDASFAYQGAGRGIEDDRIQTLARWVHPTVLPELTILVDIDPLEAQRRRAQARAADRFEAENYVFFARVRAAYLARASAEPERFFLVDGALAPQKVSAMILERIQAWLP